MNTIRRGHKSILLLNIYIYDMCVCFIYHCLSLHVLPIPFLSYILELLVFVRMKKRSLHNSMLSRSWLVHVWKFIVILLTYWCIEHSPPLFVWEVPPCNIIRVQCHLHSLEVSPCWELYWFAFNGVHNWCYNLTWQKNYNMQNQLSNYNEYCH